MDLNQSYGKYPISYRLYLSSLAPNLNYAISFQHQRANLQSSYRLKIATELFKRDMKFIKPIVAKYEKRFENLNDDILDDMPLGWIPKPFDDRYQQDYTSDLTTAKTIILNHIMTAKPCEFTMCPMKIMGEITNDIYSKTILWTLWGWQEVYTMYVTYLAKILKISEDEAKDHVECKWLQKVLDNAPNIQIQLDGEWYIHPSNYRIQEDGYVCQMPY